MKAGLVSIFYLWNMPSFPSSRSCPPLSHHNHFFKDTPALFHTNFIEMPVTRRQRKANAQGAFGHFSLELKPEKLRLLKDFIIDRPNAVQAFNDSVAHCALQWQSGVWTPQITTWSWGLKQPNVKYAQKGALEYIIETANGLETNQSFLHMLHFLFTSAKSEDRVESLEELASI